MKVVIDDRSGFCFGVVKAISTAEQLLSGGERVYSLGDIVHNRVEVQRLEQLGMESLSREEFLKLESQTVLIRAHGEPPATYEEARKRGIKIIDATCDVVARLQGVVRDAYAKMKPIGGQVVILGRRGHAEVVGLEGQIDGDAIVVESLDELDRVDFELPIYLLSQTTQSLSLFEKMSQEMVRRAKERDNVVIHDTICRQVSNREPHLRSFASRFEVIIFVSGKKSSNGQLLFEVCRNSNPNSYLVEEPSELSAEWFKGVSSVGVCGATSTPKWLMKAVAERISTDFDTL